MPGDLLKLQAYVWLYMQKHEIYGVAEITATIIAHHLTPAISAVLPALGYRSIRKGIFRCKYSAFATYLISIEDLPDERIPEELKVFSNPNRRKQVFLSCVGKKAKQPLMDALTDLFESEVLKLMALYNYPQSKVKKFVQALGKEKVAAALSEKDIIAAVRGKEHIIKALLADLKPEQRQKLLLQSSRNGAAKRQNGKSKIH